MDYERIHKVQMGVISPSKLRMKLLGAHNSRGKEGGSHSSRTSPSKFEELKNAKNSLLSGDLYDGASSNDFNGTTLQDAANSDACRLEISSKEFPDYEQGNQTHTSIKHLPFKESADTSHNKRQNITKGASYQMHSGGNLSLVHPVRSQEEDGNGYDSGHDNGSTSSFEFHRGERTLQHPVTGPFFRHVPSKWNDAEKWIVNRQTMNQKVMKTNSQNQGSRQMVANLGRIALESMAADQKHSVILATDTKRINPTSLTSQSVVEKFCSDPCCFQTNPVSANGTSVVPRIQEAQNHKVTILEAPIMESTVSPTVQSVSMRDAGTEMTPIPSQEPSRTATPIGSTTPRRSPMSSLPSTPKRGAPAPSPVDATTDDETEWRKKDCKTKLSEKELQLKTRREIAALGLQLGKMNIASWASKEEAEPATPSLKTLGVDQLTKAEYEARAAAWKEVKASKHTARYRHEEIKIQAWESHQKTKIEAQMREIEAQVERMITRAQEKMLEKLAVTQQRVEEKLTAAETRRSRRAARTAQQVEQIGKTGRVPPSHIRCCSWFL